VSWTDPAATFASALLGGLFTLAGGWFAIRWQREHEAKSIAATLLAELRTTEKLMGEGNVSQFYRDTLSHWKETGDVGDRQLIVDMFDNDPQDALPVYYSMVSRLGLLPAPLAAEIVEYHAIAISINRLLVRFFGRREMEPDQVRALSLSVEQLWDRSTALRGELIQRLTDFARGSYCASRRF
jgi:hypothetical protein